MTSLSDLDDRSSTILSAEIGWAPPADPAAVTRHPHASIVGATVAAVICVLIAAVGWQIAPEGWVLGVVGLPGTTFLAWRLGVRVATATRSGAAGIAFGLAVGTILIADALVVVLVVLAAAFGSAGLSIDGGASFLGTLVGGAVYGLFLVVIGAIVVGIPVSVVVVPAAFIWAAVVRFIVGRSA